MQLLDFLKVSDVVSMHVESLQVREAEKFFIYVLEIVVREVDPLKVLWLPHNVVENVSESFDCSDLIVVEEERSTDCVHRLLAGVLSSLPWPFFCLAARSNCALGVLICLQRDVHL